MIDVFTVKDILMIVKVIYFIMFMGMSIICAVISL